MKWYDDKRNIKVAERLTIIVMIAMLLTMVICKEIDNDNLRKENIELKTELTRAGIEYES